MICVLDCSVTIAWVFEEEQTTATSALLTDVSAGGAIVPAIWPLEVTNVLMMKSRRIHSAQLNVPDVLADLSQLPITVDSETNQRAWTDTLRLASKYRLTSYDASYLELALRLNLPLATLDRELRSAATVADVVLLGL